LRQEERPLPEYAALTGVFGAVLGGFLLLGGGRLPKRVPFGDMLRIGLASYKLGRLVAKDDVTTWVRAPVTQDPDATEPKPRGVERALGELVTCPTASVSGPHQDCRTLSFSFPGQRAS
jgi:hypothetical protein